MNNYYDTSSPEYTRAGEAYTKMKEAGWFLSISISPNTGWRAMVFDENNNPGPLCYASDPFRAARAALFGYCGGGQKVYLCKVPAEMASLFVEFGLDTAEDREAWTESMCRVPGNHV